MNKPKTQSTCQKYVKITFLSILALWGIGALAVGGLFWYGYDNATAARTLQPNDPAPLFSLQDQDGRTHSLRDYQNRAVALAFLPDAQQESATQLRSLNHNLRQFDTLEVKVFAIAPIEAAAAKRLHDGEGLEFPLLMDRGGRVARQYGAGTQVNPERRVSYVIGSDGRIILPIATVDVTEHGKQLAD